MAVHVGLLTATLSFDESFSLKDKRRVLKSLLEKLRNELRVSAAETAFQNRMRTGEIAVAFLGVNRGVIERSRRRAEDILSSDPRCKLDACIWEWL